MYLSWLRGNFIFPLSWLRHSRGKIPSLFLHTKGLAQFWRLVNRRNYSIPTFCKKRNNFNLFQRIWYSLTPSAPSNNCIWIRHEFLLACCSTQRSVHVHAMPYINAGREGCQTILITIFWICTLGWKFSNRLWYKNLSVHKIFFCFMQYKYQMDILHMNHSWWQNFHFHNRNVNPIIFGIWDGENFH